MQYLSTLSDKFPDGVLTIKRKYLPILSFSGAKGYAVNEYKIDKYTLVTKDNVDSEKAICELLHRINIKDEMLSGKKYVEMFRDLFFKEVKNIISYKDLKKSGVILIDATPPNRDYVNSTVRIYDEFNLNEINIYNVSQHDYVDISDVDFSEFKYICSISSPYAHTILITGVKKENANNPQKINTMEYL